jgi:hypothetical protein
MIMVEERLKYPWTPTWIQNAPAERAEKLSGRIHRGMKAPIRRTNMLAGTHVSTHSINVTNQYAHDGKTTTEILADTSSNDTSRNRTTVANNCSNGRVVRGESLGDLHVRGVQILRTMGQEVEPGHKQHGVYAPEPMLLEDKSSLPEEDLALGFGVDNRRLCLGTQKDLALRHECSKTSCEERDSR